jgi:twitching motility protein PilI
MQDNRQDKQSLREFQTQLAEKLKQAQVERGVASKLGFVAGGRNWLVDLDQVNEVVTVSNLTEAPWVHPWFVGVASVRGVLYGCTDLAAFIGLAEPMPPGESRLLLVHPRFGVSAALRIERALGLRALAELHPEPQTQSDAVWEVARWRGDDDQIWSEISMQRLVEMPAFLEAGL